MVQYRMLKQLLLYPALTEATRGLVEVREHLLPYSMLSPSIIYGSTQSLDSSIIGTEPGSLCKAFRPRMGVRQRLSLPLLGLNCPPACLPLPQTTTPHPHSALPHFPVIQHWLFPDWWALLQYSVQHSLPKIQVSIFATLHVLIQSF